MSKKKYIIEMNELRNTPADKNYKPSGISRAEELASLAAYAWQSDKDGNLTLEMFPDAFYRGFLKGYEQAEKDLALTIEDLELLHTFLYAVKNNKRGAFTFTRLSDEQYQEVLRRFNKAKK